MHRTIAHRFISLLGATNFLNWLPDKAYLRLQYWARLDQKLDLKNPQTFNEKLQWLKLHDRKPEYTRMVDKYEAKKYVADRIGEEYIIPNLGVWDRFEDIDFDALPNRFVLKCTHDSGGLVIVRDKAKLNMAEAKKKIDQSLKKNFYWQCREWPYKDVKPRIIAEEFLEDGIGDGLRDYKFYCFHGEPKLLYISEGWEKHETTKVAFVTMDWKLAEFGRTDYQFFGELLPKPLSFDQMVGFARELSSGHAFLRVDLYDIAGKLYFSELTFSPCGGFMPFEPEEWDLKLGEMLDLPKI